MKKLFFTVLLLVSFGVFAFQPSGSPTSTGLHTLSTVTKTVDSYLSNWPIGATVPNGPVEGTPIVFNGKLYTIVGLSTSGAPSGLMRIDGDVMDFAVRPFVSTPDMHYISAFTHAGTVYVFGTSYDHQRVRMMMSTDLATWTAPVNVYTATSGQGFYNVSVTVDAAGTGFAMAAEVTDPAFPGVPFVVRFLTSTNLTSWTMTTGLYNNGVFVNCPTIRYVGGYYYMLYMTWVVDSHMTFVARSTDLVTWQNGSGYPDGATVPFVAVNTEGNNNSDVDLVEHNGKVFFLFARGNQSSWLEMTYAWFNGTMQQYFQSFFP